MARSSHKRLYILDSLRGLAALIVCFHHFFSINYTFFETEIDKPVLIFLIFISELNHLAVLFFFALSGFSIGLAVESRPLNNKAAINDYLYRRFKRIIPIYLFSILISLISGLLMQKLAMFDYSITNLIGNLFFLQTSKQATDYWFVPYGLNGPLWTLAYEMFFYLFFPIVFYLNGRLALSIPLILRIGVLLCLSLLGVLANRVFFIPYIAFFNLFIIWVLGFLVAKTYLANKNYHFIFISLTTLSILFVNQHMVRSETLQSMAEGIIITSLLYLIVTTRQVIPVFLIHSVEKPLNTLFLYTGKGSFALYALHFPLLLVLNFYNINVFVQALALLFLILASTALEEFFIKRKLLFLKINYLCVSDKQFK